MRQNQGIKGYLLSEAFRFGMKLPVKISAQPLESLF